MRIRRCMNPASPRFSEHSECQAGTVQKEVVRGLRTRNRSEIAARAYAAPGRPGPSNEPVGKIIEFA